MKRFTVLWALVLCGCMAAMAQSSQQPPTLSRVMDNQLKSVEGEFVPAAEAMPEDKFDYAPTEGEFKGVRTFAQQVRHVAAVNYMIGAALLGEKPPVDTAGESGPESLKTKADIVKFLKDSFVYEHKAYASMNDKNALQLVPSPFGQGKITRLGLATTEVGHCFDHYGQMVEYLRANGVIPPASRPR